MSFYFNTTFELTTESYNFWFFIPHLGVLCFLVCVSVSLFDLLLHVIDGDFILGKKNNCKLLSLHATTLHACSFILLHLLTWLMVNFLIGLHACKKWQKNKSEKRCSSVYKWLNMFLIKISNQNYLQIFRLLALYNLTCMLIFLKLPNSF